MADPVTGKERRHRVLSDDDIVALGNMLQAGLTAAEHMDHHIAIATWIARENKKAERREKIKAQVGGWLIITALGSLGTAAWHLFQHFLEMRK